MEVWVRAQCQEVAEKGREAGRGRRGGLVDGFDKPVGDARLAGEVDILLASKKAIESPKLGPWGEGAADGGHCANRLLVAGRGQVERLARAALRGGGFTVAAQDVLALATAGEGDRVIILKGGPAGGYDGAGRERASARCGEASFDGARRARAGAGLGPE